MLFTTRRRGRPATVRPAIDRGTPELQARRKDLRTLEPLDVCLERQLITPEQHAAGIRLRWLYAQRFGAPTVNTSDPSYLGGRSLQREYSVWQENVEKEYMRALEILESVGAKTVVANVCIFSLMPAFLEDISRFPSAKAERILAQLQHFQEGLTALVSGLARRRKE